MPKISAIITTFNRADFLKKSITSVLAQTYSDFELIILDNSSKDHTEAVIQSFQDIRIRYIKHPLLNISQTRNLGIRESKGEFIAFLDDDDEWLSNKLAIEIQMFQDASTDVALVYGGFYRIDTHDKIFYQHLPQLQGKILKELLSLQDEFTGSASNPMIRKSVIQALGGFDETVKTGEDWEFYLRLAEKYYVICTLEPIVKIRHHFGARLGDRLNDYIDLEIKVMQGFKSTFDKEPNLKSFYLQRIGGKHLRLGNISKGREYLMRAIELNVKNYLAYVQYLLSFFPRGVYRYAHRLYLNSKRSIKI